MFSAGLKALNTPLLSDADNLRATERTELISLNHVTVLEQLKNYAEKHKWKIHLAVFIAYLPLFYWVLEAYFNGEIPANLNGLVADIKKIFLASYSQGQESFGYPFDHPTMTLNYSFPHSQLCEDVLIAGVSNPALQICSPTKFKYYSEIWKTSNSKNLVKDFEIAYAYLVPLSKTTLVGASLLMSCLASLPNLFITAGKQIQNNKKYLVFTLSAGIHLALFLYGLDALYQPASLKHWSLAITPSIQLRNACISACNEGLNGNYTCVSSNGKFCPDSYNELNTTTLNLISSPVVGYTFATTLSRKAAAILTIVTPVITCIIQNPFTLFSCCQRNRVGTRKEYNDDPGQIQFSNR